MNITFLIIRKILPFVKEMIFGKGSITTIIRYDRRRFYFFLVILASFFLNIISIPSYINDIKEALNPAPSLELVCRDLESSKADYQRKRYLEEQFSLFNNHEQ